MPNPAVLSFIVGVMVILLCGLTAWLIIRRGENTDVERKWNLAKRKVIAEAQPAKVKVRPLNANETQKSLARQQQRHGRAMAVAKSQKENPQKKSLDDNSFHGRIFPNHADRMIAYIIDTEPGATVIGSSENLFKSDDFTRQFLESIKTPIIVSHDDPEDVAELKRAVNQAKIEMKARYDDGEDLAKIMIAARDELKGLYEFKKEVVAELEKATADKDLDEESVNAMVDAVNKVMEDKGMRKLSMPITTALRFQRMRERSRQISN